MVITMTPGSPSAVQLADDFDALPPIRTSRQGLPRRSPLSPARAKAPSPGFGGYGGYGGFGGRSASSGGLLPQLLPHLGLYHADNSSPDSTSMLKGRSPYGTPQMFSTSPPTLGAIRRPSDLGGGGGAVSTSPTPQGAAPQPSPSLLPAARQRVGHSPAQPEPAEALSFPITSPAKLHAAEDRSKRKRIGRPHAQVRAAPYAQRPPADDVAGLDAPKS